MSKKDLLKWNFLKILDIPKTKKLLLLNLSILLFYFTVIIIAYLRYGAVLNFYLNIVFLIVISFMTYFSKSNKFLSNFILCIILLLTYEALRSVTGIIVNTANMFPLASIDKAFFGFNFIGTVQKTFASSTVTLVSTFFYELHLPLVIIAMVLFWFTNRNAYKGYTYSLILTSFLALITFAIFPTAPPWLSGTANNLLADGYKMLLGPFSTIRQTFISVEYDKFAAFPSLHIAYAMIFFIYTFKLNKKLCFVSLPVLLGMFFSTIYLGQHYVIDLVAGIAYSLIGFFIVESILTRSGSVSNIPIK
jgi:membrane-associated phospholipid phosphatase